MMSKKVKILLILLSVIVVGFFIYTFIANVFGFISLFEDKRKTMYGYYQRTGNEIVLYDKDNTEKKIVFDNDSTIYLVHFWATWCGPCISEFDSIQKYHKNWKNVELYMVTYEDSTKLNTFLKDKKWDLPFYRADSLNVPFQPATVRHYPSNFTFYKDTLTVSVGPTEWSEAFLKRE